MQYCFVTHATHNVGKNYFSINLVKIGIKTEYGRITLKNAKFPFGYGQSVSGGLSAMYSHVLAMPHPTHVKRVCVGTKYPSKHITLQVILLICYMLTLVSAGVAAIS